MELEELIRQYKLRATVPDHEVWKAHCGLESERVDEYGHHQDRLYITGHSAGRHETCEWIPQTDDFVAKLQANGSTVTAIQPDYDNHYSILYTSGNPVTELGGAALQQMELAG